MAENSHISWTDHTFNPWIGCTKVSPACDGCYAAELMGTAGGRFKRVTWGEPGVGEGTRDRTKDWSKPRKWDRQAAAAISAWRTSPFATPETPKPATFVFCASLADVFDNAVPPAWRYDLFELIRATPNLTWLLLTKRPQLIERLFREAYFNRLDASSSRWWPRNAALGTTIEDRKRLGLNARALAAAADVLNPAFTFWSCEPLLEDLGDVSGILPDWLITGGETDQGAHRARPADPAWYRSLRDQCAAASVPFHFKQWGEWQPGFIDSEKPTWQFGDEKVCKNGKDRDPCTLDGAAHLARPAVSWA